MAATYDGEGMRIFQVYRTVVPATQSSPKPASERVQEAPALLPLLGSALMPDFSATDDSCHYFDRIYDADFKDHAFEYGFCLTLSTLATVPDLAFAFSVQQAFNLAFAEYISFYTLAYRYDESDTFSEDDLEALSESGLSDDDITDITTPTRVGASSKDTRAETASLDTTTLIPENSGPAYRYDYELTYYVNDLSYENTQVALEYGKRAEAKSVYTYGTERISKTDTRGTTTSYLYDAKGSVVQRATGSTVVQSLSYDPFGEVESGEGPYELIYAHGAEEYNPVVELTYLRARYYAPTSASFITKDTVLGSRDRINSQNRYSYAEADPICAARPDGTGNLRSEVPLFS